MFGHDQIDHDSMKKNYHIAAYAFKIGNSFIHTCFVSDLNSKFIQFAK